MGQLTNPSGFRVGHTVLWRNQWSCDRISYFKFFQISDSIYLYLQSFFTQLLKKSGFVFSHVRVYFSLVSIFIRIYLYSRDFLRFCRTRYRFFWQRSKFYIHNMRSSVSNKKQRGSNSIEKKKLKKKDVGF